MKVDRDQSRCVSDLPEVIFALRFLGEIRPADSFQILTCRRISGSRMLRLFRRAVLDIQMRCFQAAVPIDLRSQAAFEDAAHQQRPLHRIRRLSTLEHLLDLAHQASGIGNVRLG